MQVRKSLEKASRAGLLPRRVVLMALALWCSASQADQWSFDPVLTQDRFVFGEVEIVRTRDARKDSYYPDDSIEILRDGRSLALYRGVWFEDIFANAANDHFIGLSNSGIPGTAIVQFDDRGRLIEAVKHGSFVPPYCRESVSIRRDWYDDKNPDVTFEYTVHGWGTYLEDIHLRTCDGKVVSLSSLWRQSHQRSLDRAAARDKLLERIAAQQSEQAPQCAADEKAGKARSHQCDVPRQRKEAGKRGVPAVGGD